MSNFNYFLETILGFLFWMAVAGWWIRSRNWYSLNSHYELLDDDNRAADVNEMVTNLESLGFILRGYWQITGQSMGSGRLHLLEHPKSRDVAKVMVVKVGPRRVFTLVLQTRFEDGTEVVTSNAKTIAAFPRLPGITAAWLPKEADFRRLVRIHDQIRDHLGAGKQRVPIGDDTAAFLQTATDDIRAHWVKTGYYAINNRRHIYQLTWMGVVRIAVSVAWPLREIHRSRRRRETANLLRECGIDLNQI